MRVVINGMVITRDKIKYFVEYEEIKRSVSVRELELGE